MKLSERLSSLPASAALVLDNKAKAMKAAGRDIISFCVGEPDFPMPSEAMKAAISAIEAGNTKYTNASGTPELKSSVADYLNTKYKSNLKPSNIAITDGGKFAGYAVLSALCNPGDEVLIPAPYWTSYYHYTDLVGAVPVVVPCSEDTDFKLTSQFLKQYATKKTKVVILNNPNNPTGAVYSRSQVTELCETAASLGITIVADEIYADFCYTEEPFFSVLSLTDKLFDNIVLISGMSKLFAMTGWRIGYIAAPENLISAVSAFLSHTTGCPGTVGQCAAVAALSGDGRMTEEMVRTFSKRRELICTCAKEAGLKFNIPEGAFYLFADVREYGLSSADFAIGLLEKYGVVTVPCDDFGAPGYLRLSYTLADAQLKAGIDRIHKYITEIRNG